MQYVLIGIIFIVATFGIVTGKIGTPMEEDFEIWQKSIMENQYEYVFGISWKKRRCPPRLEEKNIQDIQNDMLNHKPQQDNTDP